MIRRCHRLDDSVQLPLREQGHGLEGGIRAGTLGSGDTRYH
jgi:hypothetical protein